MNLFLKNIVIICLLLIIWIFSTIKVNAYQSETTSSKSHIIETLENTSDITKTFHSTEQHVYLLQMPSNYFASIEIEQKNIPINVGIYDGEKCIYTLSHEGLLRDFPIYIYSIEKSDYRIEISIPKDLQGKIVGLYSIKLLEKHAIGPEDIQKLEARKIFFDAVSLEEGEVIQKRKEIYKKVLEAYQKLALEKQQIELLIELGNTYRVSGDYSNAIKYLNECLTLTLKTNCIRFQGRTLASLAIIYKQQGNYKEAINYAQRGLELSEQIFDTQATSYETNTLGTTYLSLGEYEKAVRYFEKTQSADEQMLNSDYIAVGCNNIGVAYRQMKQYEKAINYLNKAFSIAKTNNSLEEQGAFLANIAKTYQFMGNDEKAIDHYIKALEILKQTQDQETEAITLTNIGSLYSKLGTYDKALEFYNKALKIDEKLQLKKEEAVTLQKISILEQEKGNLIGARHAIERAIEISEGLRQDILVQDLKDSFFSLVYENYKIYIDILMRLHKGNPEAGYDVLAFEVSEKSRGRSTLELLVQAKIDLNGNLDQNLLQEYRSVREDLSKLAESLLIAKSDKERLKINERLKDVELNAQLIELKIKQQNQSYISLVSPKTLTLREVQNGVLDKDTILLEYCLGKYTSWLWVVTNTEIKSFELPKADEINKSIQNLYDNISTFLAQPKFEREKDKIERIKNSIKERSSLISSVSHILLEPAKDLLVTNKKLLIIGDENLYQLPFCLLTKQHSTENRLLIEDHQITHLISASELFNHRLCLKNNKLGKGLALFGDPVFTISDQRIQQTSDITKNNYSNKTVVEKKNNYLESTLMEAGIHRSDTLVRLPGSRREVFAIKSLAKKQKCTLFLDFDANLENVNNVNLENTKIAHFSSHAIINKNPNLTGIILSLVDKNGQLIDGFLSIQKIFSLKLNAELVVLSGCQTSLGKEVKGEGLVGFGQAFAYAGAKRVLSSAWKIDDEATAKLMTRFYYHLFKFNISPGAALRRAQIDMLKSEYSDPYFWAAFTIQGEPN